MLTSKDMRKVLDELWLARARWYIIGLVLNVDVNELEAIRMENRDNPDKCLTSVIRSYLINPSRTKSWSEIITALKSPTVSYGLLAEELKFKFLCDVTNEKSVSAPGMSTEATIIRNSRSPLSQSY